MVQAFPHSALIGGMGRGVLPIRELGARASGAHGAGTIPLTRQPRTAHRVECGRMAAAPIALIAPPLRNRLEPAGRWRRAVPSSFRSNALPITRILHSPCRGLGEGITLSNTDQTTPGFVAYDRRDGAVRRYESIHGPRAGNAPVQPLSSDGGE